MIANQLILIGFYKLIQRFSEKNLLKNSSFIYKYDDLHLNKFIYINQNVILVKNTNTWIANIKLL